MKIAISNIAWNESENDDVFSIMNSMEIHGLEIAPAKYFANIMSVQKNELENLNNHKTKYNLKLVAMQALLFGRPELKIFADDETRTTLKNYLFRLIDLASDVEIEFLVFGSPKNRKIENLNFQTAENIAIEFFNSLGEYSKLKNVTVGIEPNPAQYDCNFLCTTEDTFKFIKKVDSDGIKLHLDTGAMIMNNENIEMNIEKYLEYAGHFHISEPFLKTLNKGTLNHIVLSRALKNNKYSKWLSVEMGGSREQSNIDNVKESLSLVKELYV